MSAKERLLALQAALEERGVRDVKFFFKPGVDGLEKLSNDVADVLEAVIKGKHREMAPLHDSVR